MECVARNPTGASGFKSGATYSGATYSARSSTGVLFERHSTGKVLAGPTSFEDRCLKVSDASL